MTSRPISRSTKLLIAGGVLICLIIGIVLGTTQPWKNDNNVSRSRTNIPPSPTISPFPSTYPTISANPTATRRPTTSPTYSPEPTLSPKPTIQVTTPPVPTTSANAAMYNAVAQFIMDLGISDASSFTRFATNAEEGTGNKNTPQQKAVNHIAQNDNIFQDWVFQNVPPPAQSMAQRYVLTVMYFALSGYQWEEKTKWLDGSLHECQWYGLQCEDITVYSTQTEQVATSQIIVMPRLNLGSQQEIVTEIRLENNKLK
eukprot:CAMPEP_0197838824 /NCGR_PEP_ID=MMETSP1437-20131217/39231_1 /TAXON_ID=49252 ORGANISM="Eucampia antarctica, Strain CCMP1452" /NCGR_SAMPLE_ID=MMETSP1437 /ASSEMBLY_ACC=CAM_ASM_001096 /LENGTH=256 /DNA_ID=CAMNT_0043447233 /DNA_START=8 /DNA_END=775 /DNA_ORIENTATION=+